VLSYEYLQVETLSDCSGMFLEGQCFGKNCARQSTIAVTIDFADMSKDKALIDVTDAVSNVMMVSKRTQTGSSVRLSAAAAAAQKLQASADKSLALTSRSRRTTDQTMSHLHGWY